MSTKTAPRSIRSRPRSIFKASTAPAALRLREAEAALACVLPLQDSADVRLHRYFRANPKLGARDRAFIAETTYAVLRHLRRLDHLTGPGRDPRRLILACLVKFSGYSVSELEPHLNADETRWLRSVKAANLDELPLPAKLELPDWLYRRLAETRSEPDLIALAQGLLAPAPLDLRINPVAARREDVIGALQGSGIEARPTPYSPFGVRVAGRPAVNQHPLYLEGAIEIQDEASQLVCLLLAPKRREMVVDLCAGAGGKSLLVGALMRGQGRVYAFDVSEKRLDKLKPRLARSGLSNVYPSLILNESDARLKRLSGKIDRVLVDTPCSGFGTLRRNPDLKWRQSPESIEQLKLKQTALLERGASLLKPEGRLVYATCSVLREENQGIVVDFLGRHSEFEIVSANTILAQQRISLDTGEFLELCPHVHGTDGFFAAVLTRTA